jgi:cyclic pyranopterin phosphate synthase
MTDRVIPLIDIRQAPRAATHGAEVESVPGHVIDRRGRLLRDLRISVTDRCNFRCTYCMPKEVFDRDYSFLPHAQLLSFEEITRLARIFVAHGVEKLRLTGGEPLLRKDLPRLIEMLSKLTTPDGRPLDIALTTNGSILARKAGELAAAGLRRITVSLDGLDDAVFRRMNDVDFPVAEVLAGVDAATRAGLAPIKINMVVKRGVNDGEILPMARHFRGSGHVLRFIEFMDVGSSNGWRMDDVVPAGEIIQRISSEFPLTTIDANYSGEVAERWSYRDGGGEIGVIASVTQAFCADCTRARLSTDGRLYLCLFANHGHDLRSLLRGDGSSPPMDDAAITSAIGRIWSGRGDHYSEIRTAATAHQPKVEMSFIGG